MASEHVLTLKAQLDTTDVQNKMNKLNQQSSASSTASEVKQTSADVNNLAQSMKNLRKAIGGTALIHSFGNLAKTAQLFGDRTDAIVAQVTSGLNSLMAAAASGNVALMAMVAVMELFNYSLTEAQENAQRVAKGFQEWMSRVRDRNEYGWYKYNKQAQSVADYGTNVEQARMLQSLWTQREKAQGEVEKYLKLSKKDGETYGADFKQSVENLKRLDAAVAVLEAGMRKTNQTMINDMVQNNDVEQVRAWLTELLNGGTAPGSEEFDKGTVRQLQDALKKLDEAAQEAADKAYREAADREQAEEERIRALREAKEDWKIAEKDYVAAKGKDLAYFKKVMEEAAYAMDHVNTAADFAEAKSRYTFARSQVDSIEQQQLKMQPKASDWADMLQTLVGTAPSQYSAAGFGMGETMGATDTIERQIDIVIRLLQDQVRKDLTYVNYGDTTI